MDTQAVANIIINRIMGTCEDIISSVDVLIDEGDIDQEFFRANEQTILYKVDSEVFTCNCCNWNFPQSEMSDVEDWVCEECAE